LHLERQLSIILPMYGRLAIHRGPAFRASRGTALVAIGVLHAGLLALALHQRVLRAEAPPAMVSISLLTPERAATPRVPSTPTPRFEMPTDVLLPPPEVAWDDSEAAPPTAITASYETATPQIAPQPIAVETSAPVQISEARYLRAPVLRYPPAALAARREGSVGLRVLVAEDGHVIEVIVERSSGFAPFDEAACSAIRAALFKPYTVNGQPRTVLVRIPIDFTLKRRG
jgi:protein TonB